MHTLQLKVDDSISISFEEAEIKVENAINNISNNNGIELDEAFDKVLKA